MRLSLSHNSGYKFDGLIMVNSGCFLYPLCNYIFSILSFKIGLIENWTS